MSGKLNLVYEQAGVEQSDSQIDKAKMVLKGLWKLKQEE